MELTSELYREISRVVCVAARKMGRITSEDCEDLTQDVLLKLWMARDRIRSPKSLLALVYQAARRTRISSCRSQSSYRARLSRYWEMTKREAGGAGCEEDRCDEFVAVGDLLASLDARTANAVRRRVCDGQSYAAIGAALGVSNCTAHNIVQRGLSRLRAMLACGDDVEADVARGIRASHRKESYRATLASAQKLGIQTSIAATLAAGPHKERGQACPA